MLLSVVVMVTQDKQSRVFKGHTADRRAMMHQCIQYFTKGPNLDNLPKLLSEQQRPDDAKIEIYRT